MATTTKVVFFFIVGFIKTVGDNISLPVQNKTDGKTIFTDGNLEQSCPKPAVKIVFTNRLGEEPAMKVF